MKALLILIGIAVILTMIEDNQMQLYTSKFTTLPETYFIDYSNQTILEATKRITQRATSPDDKILLTGQYMRQNIRYSITEGNFCETNETASLVLQRGKGDCVSSSKLTAAMLSAMDVPAEIVGGCLVENNVQYNDVEIINHTKQHFNDFKRGGYFHSWVRAYNGTEWITIETTTGIIFPTKHEEEIGYILSSSINPSNGREMCYETNKQIAEACLSI